MTDDPLTRLEDAQGEIERLREENRILRTVIDSLPALVYVKDRQSRFTLANPATIQHMNLHTEADLLGKSDFDFHPPERAQDFRQEEMHLMEHNSPMFNQEQEAVDYSLGETVWYASSKLPLHNTQGEVIGLIGINHNITDRKQAELALKALANELEARVAERTEEVRRLQQSAMQRQQQVITDQENTILELSTPIIPVYDRVLALPLIGAVSARRAQHITRSLLAGISQYRARIILLDITGVAMLDYDVANYLNKTVQAARLKGARTIITGISDSVAETLIDLGIDWQDVMVLRDLQSGLLAAFEQIGLALIPLPDAE